MSKKTAKEICDALPLPPPKGKYRKRVYDKYRNCPLCKKLLHYTSWKYFPAKKHNKLCVQCSNKQRMIVAEVCGVEYDGRIPHRWKKGNRNGRTLWKDKTKTQEDNDND